LEPQVITGAISHLAVVEGATVLRTPSPQETADLLLSMAKRLQDGHRDLALSPSKLTDPRLLAEYIVSGLPRTGPMKASTLLQRFGSVRGVFTAAPTDIAAIRGFGRKTAEAIRTTLDTSYQNPVACTCPQQRHRTAVLQEDPHRRFQVPRMPLAHPKDALLAR